MRFKISLFLIFITVSASAGEQVVVKRIVDGDTITVISGGKDLKVRLIGIDTPERRENSKALRDSNRSGSDLEAILS